MSDGIDEVPGAKVTIRFEGARCVHARMCVLGNPNVFVPNAPGAWIHPDATDPEEVARIAHACPSGAISFVRKDGGPEERPPVVNVVRVRENGPLAMHADLHVAGQAPRFRATLCRCGASKAKPFCDGAHASVPFVATGEPPAGRMETLDRRDGPLEVTPLRNGPLLVKGSVEVVSGTGRTVSRHDKVALCRCGHSANRPFCDGSHHRIGFVAD